jgi:uroporphyrin-3 C-methyltransferase
VSIDEQPPITDAPKAEPEQADPAPAPPRRSFIGWLALLIALTALGLSAYGWWLQRDPVVESWATEAALESLRAKQTGDAQALHDLDARMTSLAAGDSSHLIEALNSDLATLDGELAQARARAAEMEALSASQQLATDGLLRRQTANEAALAAVAARQDRGNDQLDLAETGYLLRLAGERLQLFGDPQGADLALQFADAQLDALQDPLFLPVRRDIAESRHALASVDQPDVLNIITRFDMLQKATASWPFAGEIPPPVTPEATADAGWWERLKSAFSGLVTVRRQTSEEDALLSLDDKDYLRQGLWLQLETARLAVMRRDADTYDKALQRVIATLEQHFETSAATVSGAISEAGNLSTIDISPEMPDISTAWKRLQTLAQRRLEAPLVVPLPAVDNAQPEDGEGTE